MLGVESVFGNNWAPAETSSYPQKQKPQRERRGFYKFSGGPGRNRTTDTRIFNYPAAPLRL